MNDPGDTLTYSAFDGHYMRLVQYARVEEGTVAVPHYRLVHNITMPVSTAARKREATDTTGRRLA